METVRCLVCQGPSIADSDAEMAGDMRSMIRQRIARAKPRPDPRLAGRALRQLGTYDPPLGRPPLLWAAPVLLLAAGLWLARKRSSGAG